MAQLNISMPPALQSWVDARLSEGRYADAAEYLRDLVRRDQEQAGDETAWLRAMIDEGLASGIIDKEPEEVIEDIIAERRARRG
jgi:antitoxin ParD1/3/4